eukprot:29124-Chlamydomonas_euryale.AAC.3
MELGGKSALIVFDDADVDKAVEWAMVRTWGRVGGRVGGRGVGHGENVGACGRDPGTLLVKGGGATRLWSGPW